MNKYIIATLITLGAATWLFFSNKAAATRAEQAMANMPTQNSLIVVELFTSQGCSSCPPADRVIAELATQYGDRVLPLSYHVDYWNHIGWKDPFSKPEHSLRQQHYAARFGSRNVYTPQAVINGHTQMVGSSRTKLFNYLSKMKNNASIALSLSKSGNNHLDISIGESPQPTNATITLIEYLPHYTTTVTKGENKGEDITNYHIVQKTKSLGEWTGEPKTIRTNIQNAQGIAVIIQEQQQGRIIAANKLAL